MKKIYLFLFVPLLLSFQCEDDIDPLFSTEYYVQNNSSVDLIWLNADAEEISIESQSEQFLGVSTDMDAIILPSNSLAINAITLYKKEESGALSMVYEQNPIMDEIWEFNAPFNFEGDYYLTISDTSLTP